MSCLCVALLQSCKSKDCMDWLFSDEDLMGEKVAFSDVNETDSSNSSDLKVETYSKLYN